MSAHNTVVAKSGQRHSKACVICGAPFYGKPSHLAKRVVCSRKCSTAYQVGENNPNWRGGFVLVRCANCGKELRLIPARVTGKNCCNRACLAAYQSRAFSGSGSSKWKGGHKESRRRYLAKFARPKEAKPGVVRLCKACGEAGVAPGKSYHFACRPGRKPKPVVERAPRKSAPPPPPPAPRPGKPPKLCKYCGLPGITKDQRYHRSCRPIPSHPRVLFKCQDCGIEKMINLRPGHQQKRCRECDYAARKGEGNANWRGGVTPENVRQRRSEEYKAWRKSVFERDNYTCVECGQRGFSLHADHIKPFCAFPELRFDVSNGRTLCVECHKKTDTYLAKAKKYLNRQAAS